MPLFLNYLNTTSIVRTGRANSSAEASLNRPVNVGTSFPTASILLSGLFTKQYSPDKSTVFPTLLDDYEITFQWKSDYLSAM